MSVKFCPGSANITGTPTLEIKKCPSCGSEVELFSSDSQVKCKCGFVVYNSLQSCIKWCKHARECVGDELYDRLINNSENKDDKKEPPDPPRIR